MKYEMKQWERPELVVLVRSNPEENVLAACARTGSKVGRGGCAGSPSCGANSANRIS
jgi:hypothetical protein